MRFKDEVAEIAGSKPSATGRCVSFAAQNRPRHARPSNKQCYVSNRTSVLSDKTYDWLLGAARECVSAREPCIFQRATPVFLELVLRCPERCCSACPAPRYQHGAETPWVCSTFRTYDMGTLLSSTRFDIDNHAVEHFLRDHRLESPIWIQLGIHRDPLFAMPDTVTGLTESTHDFASPTHLQS